MSEYILPHFDDEDDLAEEERLAEKQHYHEMYVGWALDGRVRAAHRRHHCLGLDRDLHDEYIEGFNRLGYVERVG